MPLRNLVTAVLILLVGVVGWGASSGDEASSQAAGPTGPDLVPMGPRPRDVVPLSYRVAFTIDPSKPRFAGHDEIDVSFAEARRAIYLEPLTLARTAWTPEGCRGT